MAGTGWEFLREQVPKHRAHGFTGAEMKAVVKLQPKQLMDKALAVVYLDWLATCYPGEKIGLIWDFAAAHKSADVLEHVRSLNIAVCFIPAGPTSIHKCAIYL